MANPKERNVNAKTQVQTANLGHPPPLYTSPRRTVVIFSPRSSCPQTKTSPSPGHPPKSGTPKPATMTSAPATIPTASAAGSAPTGPPSPLPFPTPPSPTPKPSTYPPCLPTTPNPSPTPTTTHGHTPASCNTH